MKIDITWFLTAVSLIVPLSLHSNGDPIQADGCAATVFNIRKKIICIYIWLIGDILWFTLDYIAGTYGRAALDFVQVLLAICGILEWKKGVILIADRKNKCFKIKSSKI